jgi:hypothetical protein
VPLLRTVAILAATLAATAACGGTPPDTLGNEPRVPLTSGELGSALLTTANLGNRYVVKRTPDRPLDCLPIDVGTTISPTEKARRDFVLRRNKVAPYPQVLSLTGTYRDLNTVLAEFDEYATAFADCPTVDETQSGVRARLRVTVDRNRSSGSADDQFNVKALGTASVRGVSVPFGLWLTGVRIDNDVMVIGYVSLTTHADAAFNRVRSAAYGRFQAVVHGDKVPDPHPVLPQQPVRLHPSG